MSQIHLVKADISFNLHPRHLNEPLVCLEIALTQNLNRFVPQLGGYIIAYENLALAQQTAAVTYFSANLIASACADLLVFVPERKFVVENRQNSSLGRAMFAISNPSTDQYEVCRLKEYKEGKMVVQWFDGVGAQVQ